MSTVPVTAATPAPPGPGSAARRRTGGLLLALASALGLLGALLYYLLPAVNPGDPVPVRAARIAGAAAAFRAVGILGIVRSLGLALAAALLAVEPPAPAGARAWRAAAGLAWRLMLVAAVLDLAVNLFNAFALIPLARAAAAGHPGPYGFAETLELRIVGAAVLLFSIAALVIFAVETAGHHRRIGSGWIAFGIVSGAIGIPGGVGMIANLPKLAMLMTASYLAFVPLLRLGVRLAAGAEATRRAP